MAPVTPAQLQAQAASVPNQSYIHVANQYLFHQQITGHLVAIGTNVTREDQFRLLGVQWINETRLTLQLLVPQVSRESLMLILREACPYLLYCMCLLSQVPPCS